MRAAVDEVPKRQSADGEPKNQGYRWIGTKGRTNAVALLKREIADRQLEIAKLRHALALFDDAGPPAAAQEAKAKKRTKLSDRR